jgi:hypothetical protein
MSDLRHFRYFTTGFILAMYRKFSPIRHTEMPKSLSENLSLILENKVVSTCRPPRSSPSSMKDVERNHSMKQLCTTPFVYEMRTLARIYEPILPFSLASKTIPPKDEIYNYTFYLRNHEIDEFNRAASAYLTLILWDQHLILDIGDAAVEHLQYDIRPLLDSSWGDEMDQDFYGPKLRHLERERHYRLEYRYLGCDQEGGKGLDAEDVGRYIH